MNNDFYLSINDQDRWKTTDSERQHAIIESLIEECNKCGAGKINKVSSGFVTNTEADVANLLISGLSIPVVLTSIGYLFKHLSPLLVEYMRSQSSKEITVDIHGKKITIKGGVNFETDLKKVITEVENLGEKDENA